MRACFLRGAFALLALIVLLSPPSCHAESFFSAFRDPDDGAIDLSEWLLERKGFLPVPIIITEPAVGYGGGLAVAFFRQSVKERAIQSEQSGHMVPPDIFGAAAIGTENGTKGAGAGGMFSFRDDRWRYRGGVVAADANLDFYGLGQRLQAVSPNADEPLKVAYSLEGWASSQQAILRLGESRHFLALRWVYLDFESLLDRNEDPANAPEVSFATTSSGVGPSWEYDSRDNIFTPSRGMLATLDSLFYREDLGGDRNFETYRGFAFAYWPFAEAWVLGGRVDGRAARGDAPFYQMPYIELRGIPAARHQDQNVAVLETELRWNFTERWALIGFVGAGRAWGIVDKFDEVENEVSKGIGVRYRLAKALGLYAGIDVAWGPEEEVFYLQVGSAWR